MKHISQVSCKITLFLDLITPIELICLLQFIYFDFIHAYSNVFDEISVQLVANLICDKLLVTFSCT